MTGMTSPWAPGSGLTGSTAGMGIIPDGHWSLWHPPGKLRLPGVEKGATLPHTPLLTLDKELKLLAAVFGGLQLHL